MLSIEQGSVVGAGLLRAARVVVAPLRMQSVLVRPRPLRRLLDRDRVDGAVGRRVLPVETVIVLLLLGLRWVLRIGPSLNIHIVQTDLALVALASGIRRNQIVVLLGAGQVLGLLLVELLGVALVAVGAGTARHGAAVLRLTDATVTAYLLPIVVVVEVCVQLDGFIHRLIHRLGRHDAGIGPREGRMRVDSARADTATGQKLVVRVLGVQSRADARLQDLVS